MNEAHLNGHAKQSIAGKADPAPSAEVGNPTDKKKPAPYVLRVRRVEPGESMYVRMLSDDYCGLMTHWFRGKSHYCCPHTCPPVIHKERRYWKGYAAAEMFDEPSNLWLPIVFELTENLELDMRGVFKRGQVWNVFRFAAEGVGEPVRGAVHETIDPASLRPAFDIRPCVRTLYHWLEEIPLNVKNPLPARTIVEAISGDAPEALQLRERPRPEPTQREKELMEAYKQRMKATGTRGLK